MNVIEILKSFFTFQFPKSVALWVEKKAAQKWGSSFPSKRREELPSSSLGARPQPKEKSSLDKIWFDNIFRVWVSLITFAICFLLYIADSIERFSPIFVIFILYVITEIAATWFLFRTRFHRQTDFCLCGTDLIGISFAIFLTGGINSPFYFLYFIPLVIQAFHRDWSLLLFYGFGGIVLYSITMFFSLSELTGSLFMNLVARIGAMLLTVCTSILAVLLLRKKEFVEGIRLSRMKMLMQVTELLNSTVSLTEIQGKAEIIVDLLNHDFAEQTHTWSRLFLSENNGALMNAIMSPPLVKPELKQQITAHSCPAVSKNQPFYLSNSESQPSCPTESFSFRSHLCIPISGTANETYGVIFCGSAKPNAYGPDEQEFLTFIGRALGLTIQRLKRVEELQLSLEMDSCATAAFLASTKNFESTILAILEGIRNILKSDQASFMLWDPKEGILLVKEAVGPYAGYEKNKTFRMGEGVPGRTMETGKPIWISDPGNEETLKNTPFAFKSLLSLPLQRIRGEFLGVITVWYLNQERHVSPYEIDIAMTYITRATLAFENALLHQKSKEVGEDRVHKEAA